MPNVLLAWELGDGLGHLARLLPVAKQLRARGTQCFFAARNVVAAGKYLREAKFPVFQSPYVSPQRRGAISSIGDVLATIGYLEPGDLEPLVRSWSALIQALDVDLLIADYSPTATLASLGDVPVITLGDSFTLPTTGRDGQIKPFQTDATPAIPEDQILSAVNVVQQRIGKKLSLGLAECLLGNRGFIVTLPELCFRRESARENVGPLSQLPAPAEEEPTKEYFAYLSLTAPGVAKVLTALSTSGLSGSIYLRDATSAVRQEWRERGLSMLDAPAHMETAVSRAALLIHHGGLGTCEFGLSVGRPQLIIPRHQEQAMNGACLRRLHVAVATVTGGRFEVQHVNAALAQVRKEQYRRAAAERARIIARRGPCGGLATVLQACEKYLTSQTSRRHLRPN